MKHAALQSVPIELRRMLALVGVSGLATINLVAAAMVIRRMALASGDASAGVVLGVGLSAILCAVAFRELASLGSLNVPARAIGWLGTAAVALACLGLSIPPTSAAAAITVWLTAIVVEGVYWARQRQFFHWQWPLLSPTAPADHHSSEQRIETAKPSPTADSHADPDDLESPLADDLLSQLTRSRTEAGGEAIYALVRAEFTAGERQQWLNVAFCPPLATRPSCSAHFLDETEAILDVEEIETYGARLMVRLPQAAGEACSLVVEMIAEA